MNYMQYIGNNSINNIDKLSDLNQKIEKKTISVCITEDMGASVALGENESGGIKKKPAPDMVNLALEKLGSSKSESIYVGDSEVDILTAKYANLKCISCSWGFRTKEELLNSGANIIIEEPKELLSYLDI